ncbi:MAG: DUF1016 family protein [Bacteroidales bacterium]|nr:DUF1016 family protein [Bacteroidales bacterium]
MDEQQDIIVKQSLDSDAKTLQHDTELLYANIRGIISSARQRAYTAVNFAMVESYWLIGQQIVEHEQQGASRAGYGKGLLRQVATRLTKDFGKGFDERELRKMRQFYMEFQIRDTLRPELTWSHYRRLLSVENEQARLWYMNEAADNVWSSRQLDRQISTLYYERLLASREKKTVVEEANEKLGREKPTQFIHDPYVLDFLDLKDYPTLHENDLEQALIDHLQQFLLELGRGFCFVARQKRMRYDDDDFYVDLVFYHSILKCHVLIDLKLGKLTHEDVGQMDSYIRMFDALYKNEDDNPTLGIILCSQKSETIVKYSVLNEGKQLFASRYKLYLPTEDEFKKMLESL